jgi:hypothetical protein
MSSMEKKRKIKTGHKQSSYNKQQQQQETIYLSTKQSAMNMKNVLTIKFRQDITCKVHIVV